MKTYAEFLRDGGASEDEIKILDVPTARKIYESTAKQMEKLDADFKAAQADAADKAAKVAAYDKWYQEVAEPTATRLKDERDVAKAEADAERARLKSLQEAGLIKLETQKTEPTTTATSDTFDPKKHNLITSDVLRAVAEKEGDAIAAMADIQDEHRELFGTRINARELRKEALAQNKSLEEVWMTKYNVAATREKKAAESKAAYDEKLREEGRQQARQDQGSNPLLKSGAPSSNPWTNVAAKRTSTDGKDNVLPWQGNLEQRSNERVNRALQSLQQKGII